MEIQDKDINNYLRNINPDSEEYADMKEIFLSLRDIDTSSAIFIISLLIAQQSSGREGVIKILNDIENYFNLKNNTVYIVFDTSINVSFAFSSYKDAEEFFKKEVSNRKKLCAITEDMDTDPKNWKPSFEDGGVIRKSVRCIDNYTTLESSILLIELEVKHEESSEI